MCIYLNIQIYAHGVPMTFDERKEKIINYLKAYGSITNNDAKALTYAHRNTISSDFKKLLELGILASSGKGKGFDMNSRKKIFFRLNL